MMVTIAAAIIKSFENAESESVGVSIHQAKAFMIGIAYSASIGGMATPVGTPPNLAFINIYQNRFPEATSISFVHWLSFGFPLALVLIVGVWLIISRIFLAQNPASIDRQTLVQLRDSLGPIKRDQIVVAAVFGLMAGLWILRKDIPLGMVTIPGWSRLFTAGFIDDGTVAVFCAMLLFGMHRQNGERFLDHQSLSQIPWHTILLFGGGFALAKGMATSGLSVEIGSALSHSPLRGVSMLISTTLGMSLLTELTSNMASTQMILPILAEAASTLGLSPYALMMSATLGASCAFMLPAATAPNAIIFGSGYVKIRDMVRVGVWANLFAVSLISLFASQFF